jgi:hypothetical protein
MYGQEVLRDGSRCRISSQRSGSLVLEPKVVRATLPKIAKAQAVGPAYMLPTETET